MSGKPAATVGSMHTCPMYDGKSPHVGGPITQGEVNILHNGKPAATMGSICTCSGPPDTVVQGHPGIFHNGKPAACMGDMTAHGGVITTGEANIIHGFVTEPMAPMTMPVAKIPFPEFSLATRILGKAKEAEAKQQQLREETEGEPRVFNIQWKKSGKAISSEKVLKQVAVTADVVNVPDGGTVDFDITIPSDTPSEEAQIISISGTVQDKKVEALWEEIQDSDTQANTPNS